jgi:predicted nucleic acid-binding protein
MKFVDANIFLRFLTRDDAAKADACGELLRRIDDGDEEAFTIEAAIVEVLFVLLSPHNYNLSRAEAVARVTGLLSIRNLGVAHRSELRRACSLFVQFPDLDLADALAVAYMETAGCSEVVSYDRDFDAIPWVTRIAP